MSFLSHSGTQFLQYSILRGPLRTIYIGTVRQSLERVDQEHSILIDKWRLGFRGKERSSERGAVRKHLYKNFCSLNFIVLN